jgi:phosphoribosylaminoimidazole-succinocarboxamide synthase
MTKNIIVLISGNGTNLQKIIDEQIHSNYKIILVVSNRIKAFGLERAKNANIPTVYSPFKRKSMDRIEYDHKLAEKLISYNPDLIVLAGWMHILSKTFLDYFPNKVINLHPALPGQFPGKDAIGQAFEYYKNKGDYTDAHTGVMCHYVIPEIDAGEVISKLKIPIYENDDLNDLKIRVQLYEKRVLMAAVNRLTRIPGLVRKGKVRDIFEINDRTLALVQTDRQSAFDRHICNVPNKGRVLTGVSGWWFRRINNLLHIPTHYIAHKHNVMFVKKCTVIPIEVVVRDYMTGSTKTSIWTHYKNGGRRYCGHPLRDGYVKNQQLDNTIITPTTKGEVDEPITCFDIVERGLLTKEQWDYVEETAMRLFKFGQRTASAQGLILVDTKYEFGFDEDGEIVLIDEVHTCDSSRFWQAGSYQKQFNRGEEPHKYDKDVVRLWIRANCEDPYKALPDIPEMLVKRANFAYCEFYRTLLQKPFRHSPLTNPTFVTSDTLLLELQTMFLEFVPGSIIISGSHKDDEFVGRIQRALNDQDVPSVYYSCSAHKETLRLIELLERFNNSRSVVFVTVAGRSNALSGVVASNSRFPVIACPPHKDKLDMLVNIHSSLQCPSNVPVMTVLDPNNAALSVKRILDLE